MVDSRQAFFSARAILRDRKLQFFFWNSVYWNVSQFSILLRKLGRWNQSADQPVGVHGLKWICSSVCICSQFWMFSPSISLKSFFPVFSSVEVSGSRTVRVKGWMLTTKQCSKGLHVVSMMLSAKCGAEDGVCDGEPGLSHCSAGWNRNVVSANVHLDRAPQLQKGWTLVEKVMCGW